LRIPRRRFVKFSPGYPRPEPVYTPPRSGSLFPTLLLYLFLVPTDSPAGQTPLVISFLGFFSSFFYFWVPLNPPPDNSVLGGGGKLSHLGFCSPGLQVGFLLGCKKHFDGYPHSLCPDHFFPTCFPEPFTPGPARVLALS